MIEWIEKAGLWWDCYGNVEKKTLSAFVINILKWVSHWKMLLPDLYALWSVKNYWEWFTIGSLTITTVKEIIVSTHECKQQVRDEEHLSRRYHQSYCKVEVGVGTASIDPQIPQHRRHYDTNAVHYCRQEHVASVRGKVAPHRQQR